LVYAVTQCAAAGGNHRFENAEQPIAMRFIDA